MHNAFKVIGCVAHLRIARSIIFGSSIDIVSRFVLGLPVAVNIIPEHREMRSFAIEVLRTIRSLLFVTHPQDVAKLMGHVAHVKIIIAPAQIYSHI